MPVFGGYETVSQQSATPFESVYKAKAAGGSGGADFIVKTFKPRTETGDLRKHPEVLRFLGSAKLQQKVAAAGSRHWAPVQEMGISGEEAWYVSTFYPMSASRLIKGRANLSAEDLHAMTSAVLAGLVELKNTCQRSHGNLNASFILLPRKDASCYGDALLAEPVAAESSQPGSEKGDLAALGRVLYELVMRRPYNVAGTWPIEDSPEWARMGRQGAKWREFCNKLLSSDPADAMTLEGAQAELTRLRPKKGVPMWALAAAVVLLVAIGGGIFAYLRTRPDTNFKKEDWVVLCDAYQNWFRVFAEPSEQANLQGEYSELVAKARQNKVLNPREMVSGNMSLEEARGTPPTTRDGINAAKDAIVTATVIQGQLMRKLGATAPEVLTATAVPDALLKKLDSVAQKYSDRGLKEPAEQVRRQADGLRQKKGGDLIVQLREVLQQLTVLNQNDQNLAAIDKQIGLVVDKDDPVLKRVPDLVKSAVYVEGSRDPVADLSEKLAKFKTELASDAEWTRFFDFVEHNWKPKISVNKPAVAAFRQANPIYAMFASNTPPQLSKFHLMEWMKDAGNYGSLTDPNPAKNAGLLARAAALSARVTQLFDDYKKAGVEESPVKRLQETSSSINKRLAELGQQEWWTGTREKIEQGTAEVTIKLGELEKAIAIAQADIRDVSIAQADQLLARIEERKFQPPLNGIWDKLKEKWRVKDPGLKKELESQKARNDLFQLSEAAAKQLRAIESSLPEATDFPSLVRNRKWGDGLAKALGLLEASERYKALEDAARLVNFDRMPAPGAPVPAANPEAIKAYQDWCERAKVFVALPNDLEDRLDTGYGFVADSTGKPTDSQTLLKDMRANPLFTKQVESALSLLLGRCEQIQALSGKPAASLSAIAEKEADAALAIDAWRLLGASPTWPASGQDLESELNARKHLPQVIIIRANLSSQDKGTPEQERLKSLATLRLDALEKELAEQGPARWKKFVMSPPQGEMEAALAKALNKTVMAALGVDDYHKLKLPPEMQFNLFLVEARREISALPQKIDDKSAQEMVSAISKSLPAGDGGNAAGIEELRGKLKKLADEPGGGAVAVDAGPASKQAQKPWDRAPGNDDVVSFRWNGHQLTFVRVEGTGSDDKALQPYFLCTTEMSYGLFRDLMDATNTGADVLGLPENDGMRGPQVWERYGTRIKTAPFWLKKQPQRFEDYPATLAGEPKMLRGDDHNPRDDMPMQFVPPQAALYIASLLGCRLPTYEEWRLAAKSQKTSSDIVPNLRDASWELQRAHVKGLRDSGSNQAKFPDAGMFQCGVEAATNAAAKAWTAQSLQQAQVPGIANSYNDNFLWFRPVQQGAQFSDLIGNVAEIVFDDPASLEKLADKSIGSLNKLVESSNDKVLVVGGSCISAPEFGIFDRRLLGINNGYADVGFRLAFSAGKKSIVDQLKEIMSEQKYLVLANSGRAPAN